MVGWAMQARSAISPGWVHAQLDHAQAVLRGQAQQRQRHANRVVEIAARGKSGLARCGGQDAGQHLRDGGFAIAAGHRHQWQAKLAAPTGGQRPQGGGGIAHLQARQTGQAAPQLDHGGSGTGRLGLGQKVVRIQALAAQGDEQIAGLHAAAVGVDALQGKVLGPFGSSGTAVLHLGQGLGHPGSRLGQSHHGWVLSWRACTARAASW